jgi:hypothetical protein
MRYAGTGLLLLHAQAEKTVCALEDKGRLHAQAKTSWLQKVYFQVHLSVLLRLILLHCAWLSS